MNGETTTAETTAGTTGLENVEIIPPANGYPAHPLAAVFPMLPEPELKELAESVKTNGLREKVVLLAGEVLDGRNRQAACLLAGVPPIYREFGSDPADGKSPADFVVDHNMRRRQLTDGQKAAAAVELLPFFEREAAARQTASQFTGGAGPDAPNGGFDPDTPEEQAAAAAAAAGEHPGGTVRENLPAPDDNGGNVPESTVDTSGDFAQTPPKKTATPAGNGSPVGTKIGSEAKGRARQKAAEKLGVSDRSVATAANLQKNDPKKFAEVKAGTTTLNKAATSTPTAGSKAAEEYDAALTRIGKVCGQKMAQAVKEGAILRSRAEVLAFAKLEDQKMHDTEGLVGVGWKVAKAVLFKAETLLPNHTIMDAIARAAQSNGTFSQLVVAEDTGADWEVTVKRKAKAPAASTAPAASSAPATPAKKAPAAKTPPKAAKPEPKKPAAKPGKGTKKK